MKETGNTAKSRGNAKKMLTHPDQYSKIIHCDVVSKYLCQSPGDRYFPLRNVLRA